MSKQQKTLLNKINKMISEYLSTESGENIQKYLKIESLIKHNNRSCEHCKDFRSKSTTCQGCYHACNFQFANPILKQIWQIIKGEVME